MPDTSFTWPNLKEHLRKFAVVYLVVIAVCLVLTSLLWTTTQPRTPSDQVVLVYLADSYSNPEALNALAPDLLSQLQAEGSDVQSVEFEGLLFSQDTDYSSSMLLVTRLATGEGDAFFASQAAMDALVRSGALLDLEETVAGGWLAQYGLEPYYAEVTDPETEQTRTFLAGLKLDGVSALSQMQAFNNQGAYLALPVNGENTADAQRTLELLLKKLTEESHAESDGAE